MVNDLKPNLPRRTSNRTQRVMVPYISLSRTKGLIEDCISHYVNTFNTAASNECTPEHVEETMNGMSTTNAGYQFSPAPPYPLAQRRRQSPPPSPSRPPPVLPLANSDGPNELSMPTPGRSRSDSSRSIFRNLEKYIVACFNGTECINASFSLVKPPLSARAKSESSTVPTLQSSESSQANNLIAALSPVDAKTLLLGDFAENGMWWAGK